MAASVWYLVLAASFLFNLAYLTYHFLTGAPLRCLFLPSEWCIKAGHRGAESHWRWIFLAEAVVLLLVGLVWLTS